MISNRCQYALKAVLELAKNEARGRVPISEIAKNQEIPPRFLETILRQLKRAGITESIRGKDGGYKLARPASQITMGEVVELLEGPLTERARSPERNVFTPVWDRAESAVQDVLDNITFAKLREDDLAMRIDQSQNYSI